MKKVQVNEVREKLAKYLAEAERGEEIVITKHSKPIAKLVAYEEKKSKFPDLTEFRKGITVKGKPMSQVVIDMRREERF
jgi:prevent-host-death family protein